jgi:hypothetical protein
MAAFLPNIRRLAGLGLVLLAATPAWSQEAKVHKMEIYNGPLRTVHYFSPDLSQGERIALSDLQQAENNLALSDNLTALRNQYVRDERELQRRRTIVQNLLYGNSTSYASGFYPGFAHGGGFYGGFAGPGFFGYAPGLGWGGGFGTPYPIGNAGTTTQSLAFGVGDEGAIKTEIARVLATQATPAYATQARADYHAALGRAGESKNLASALNLKQGDPLIRPAAGPETSARWGVTPGDSIKLTLRGDKTLDGTFVGEDSEWATIDSGGDRVSVRKSEVTGRSVKIKK